MAEAKKAAPGEGGPRARSQGWRRERRQCQGGPKHTPATTKPRGRRKTRIGYVVSDKMQKTIVVELERPYASPEVRQDHPYHQEGPRCTTSTVTPATGDRVSLMETRPAVGHQALAARRDPGKRLSNLPLPVSPRAHGTQDPGVAPKKTNANAMNGAMIP